MKKIISIILGVVLLMGIPFSASAVDVTESIAETYDHAETGMSIPYRLVLPEEYDEQGNYPLVVFFHGAGERGNNNESQLVHCIQQIADHMPQAIILVPQCPYIAQWVNTPWANGSYSTDEIPESDPVKAVMSLVEQITQEYAVNRATVYAMGISMGGYAVWDVMIRHYDVFAAGVAVCGAGDPSKAEVLKDVPMFVFHGNVDESVPVSGSRESVDAIQNVGGTKVQYSEYPGAGHGIWFKVFNTDELYEEVLKCTLPEQYLPEPEPVPETQPATDPVTEPVEPKPAGTSSLPYWIGGGIGLLAIACGTLFAIARKRKKQRQ